LDIEQLAILLGQVVNEELIDMQ